jgi:tetratricopeptide (TPR) repeat protein
MEACALYKINVNLSIFCILILIGSILTTVISLALQFANAVLAQSTSSSVDISNLNSSITYAEVIKYYNKALTIKPNDTIVLDNKGIVLIKLGNYTQAIQYFDKVLSIDPNNVGGLYNKAVALNKLGKSTEAKVFQEKAQQINPNYSGQFINKVSIVSKTSKEGVLAKNKP